MAISNNQEKFVLGVVSGLSQREAYRQAYPNSKMSDAAVDAEASNMLNATGKYKKNPKISLRYKELMQKMEDEAIADGKEVLKYLTSVMRREKKDSVVVTLNTEETKYFPDENGTMRKQTIKKEVPQLVEIPAKLSDANKAAELLGKKYSLFKDKVEVSGLDEEKSKLDDLIKQMRGGG